MASSAFKSTTKRTPIGPPAPSPDDSTSTNRSSIHRRSRSLSRFSHRMPSSPVDKTFDEVPSPRGRFVNTKRGSGFPEISLDDLAVEFFASGDRGRSAARNSEPSAMDVATASYRRGRSVSRHSSSKTGGTRSESKGKANYSVSRGKGAPESHSKRRRSLSVVRYHISESDLDRSQNSGARAQENSFGVENKQKPVFHRSVDSNRRSPALRRSLSQKDFRCHDGYSSQSSVLTDDEGKDAYFISNGIQKPTQTLSAKKARQPNGDVNGELYEAMRKELRHAVEEIWVGLEQEMVNRKASVEVISDDLHSNEFDVHQRPFARVYSTKHEQSEKRKDLLAKSVLEEQRGQELSKMVKNLPPDKKNIVVENATRTKKRSNDRSKMSKRLSEEAEKYIEDFISNIEDTDISSLDGDRSDTSSSIGGITSKPDSKIPAVSKYAPSGMDGVMLPWLQWETSNDVSPYVWRNRIEPPMTPKANPWNATQEAGSGEDESKQSSSSQGSWSPGVSNSVGVSGKMGEGEDIGSRFRKCGNNQSQSYLVGSRGSGFDMDEYVNPAAAASHEDFLLETWNHQQKTHSTAILLCHRLFF